MSARVEYAIAVSRNGSALTVDPFVTYDVLAEARDDADFYPAAFNARVVSRTVTDWTEVPS